MEFDDDACSALLAKRDKDASADDGRGVRGDAVGEDHVQRDRDSDVAEFGHRIQRISVRVEERLIAEVIRCRVGEFDLHGRTMSSFARPGSPFDFAQGGLGGCPHMSTDMINFSERICLFRRLFWWLQSQMFHDHLQIFPGLTLLARIAEKERGMVGDRELCALP